MRKKARPKASPPTQSAGKAKDAGSSARSGARHGLRNYQHPDRFGEWLGYKVIEVDREKNFARAELELRDDHLSPAGRIHGGVVAAFFDYACGAAVFSTMSPDDFASTVEIKVNYLRPLNVGERLIAETRVVFRGKRICVIHGFVYKDGEDKPSAMASSTFNIVSPEARK